MRTDLGDDVTEIWFSRPELLPWDPQESRCGQELIVEGGAILPDPQVRRTA